MQKFSESDEPLSERRNIVVMADEAHRSQYGLEIKLHTDGTHSVGDALKVRQAERLLHWIHRHSDRDAGQVHA